jgi:hypothetical protein
MTKVTADDVIGLADMIGADMNSNDWRELAEVLTALADTEDAEQDRQYELFLRDRQKESR